MVSQARLNSFSSMAFIGLPWPTNRAGMRRAAVLPEVDSVDNGRVTIESPLNTLIIFSISGDDHFKK
jgi:hypothetical protein